jgi:hypothetical protein
MIRIKAMVMIAMDIGCPYDHRHESEPGDLYDFDTCEKGEYCGNESGDVHYRFSCCVVMCNCER